jgi:BirA family biotin operon repressor/biotin-[acetyl-CoA-carboxylase] ligase
MKHARSRSKTTRQEIPRKQRLLVLLADGKFHSGEALANKLKVSRSAVWKLVRALRTLGIEVQAVPRQGYRLPRPVDLYASAKIRQHLVDPRALIDRLDVLLHVDSTNSYLLEQPAPEVGRANVCVAEIQHAGRGRRGRTWVAPFGSGICLSLGWRFPEAPPTLSAFSLVVGVALARALREMGATDIGLKWPNDVVWKGRKLAGVLVDVRGESAGPTQVIVGIGVNLRMPAEVRMALAEQQATVVADLHEIMRDRTPERNMLTAALITHLLAVVQEFGAAGFAAFAAEWRQLDALADAAVKVVAGNESVLGTARGVTAEGALHVEVQGGLRQFYSADVSLRAVRI